jgi:hypothetical protein
MNLLGKAGIAVLSVVLGAPALMYAQDEPKQDPRPEPKTQDEVKPPKQEQSKPEAQQDETKPSKEEKKEEKEEKKQQENVKPPKGDESTTRQPAAQQGMSNGGSKAAGQGGGHIPDNQFHAHFGRAHTVVINQPVIVEGQPRFQFGGYWFIIAAPWPGDWLYTDQCYIDYVDGEYVLFDLLHPGVSIELTVVM